ncbi:MAG: NAD-dependent malic enzyme [Acidimicrobiaceae bacterium]|nr:NAD-dependent malic enzyme [Acidimicrobiaceae bacterium]MYE75793.1 NAD-dependent malic enzyme [Acidimicrobiaceae bacterium]MYE96978.1 NAD-dependent malic enzyme [Acidimicrobiaceae bacterium]MYH42941.1 NAD-dependent malic enzyme [Acidimicrobiaceae bacterium]MYI53388.1 NAD-dependent malic enzyme [Acidimicrobiaceae bacterium]
MIRWAPEKEVELDTPTPAYSITIKVSLGNRPGTLGRFATAIGDAGGNIAAIPGFEAKGPVIMREIDVLAESPDHARDVVAAVSDLDGVTVLDWWDRTFRLHEGGKIEVNALCSVGDAHDLAMAYTPGVARVCKAIQREPMLRHTHTIVRNIVAIVTDGTAVLGLGDIGPAAALPVMEGKALLFKEFGGVDAFPVCLDVTTADELVDTVVRMAPSFGGINLEDIAAPAAFEIEDRLIEALDIPVFHDDQHGTAIVTTAALWNALKLVNKQIADVSVVVSGTGAAGLAVAKMLHDAGVGEIVGVDRAGAIHAGRSDLNDAKQWFVHHSNPDGRAGSLSEVIRGADVFVGLSAPGLLSAEDVRSMAHDPIVFAMANPDPEIRPEEVDGLAAVMATGRSDFPNQINNVLAFPGVFRGALDAGATCITERMKAAAARAIAEVIGDEDLDRNYIVPSVFDRRVATRVAARVAACAVAEDCVRAVAPPVPSDLL